MTLAELKRIPIGTHLALIKAPSDNHPLLNHTRQVVSRCTSWVGIRNLNGMVSRLDFPKAKDFTATEDGFIIHLSDGDLTYRIIRLGA